MGDGHVAMILDPNGIASVAGVDVEAGGAGESQECGSNAIETFLVFAIAEERYASPVAQIARVERIPREDLEFVGGLLVTESRGDILELQCPSLLGAIDMSNIGSHVFALIPKHGPPGTGLIATELIDSIELPRPSWRDDRAQAPVQGRQALCGNITSLLHLEAVWPSAHQGEP